MTSWVWRLCAALAFMPGAAFADYQAGEFSQAQTRHGVLQVVGPLGQQRVMFNGADLGIENYAYAIDGVWAVQGGTQDWAILTSRHGGNMCGGYAHIAVMLTATRAVRTDEFSVCQGGPIDVRVTVDAVELDIADPGVGVTHRIFRFDGAALTETPVAQAAGVMPGPGADVTRWLTSFPRALTQDASERMRFSQILTPAQMVELNTRLSGPGRVEQRGDWVIGRGCQAHACNLVYALWAIRISDGRPMAIFRDKVAGSEFDRQTVFGGDVAQTDRTALEIIMEIAP